MFTTLGLTEKDYESYGNGKYKLSLNLLDKKKRGKLILMTSINPTPAGEGKTTMNIALSMALNKIGENAVSCLREPSLGPNFGRKGSATGGGKCEVVPAEDINLHFTGDFHAITSAHNLLAAFVDNHVFHGNDLDLQTIYFNRVMDMNDRSLRSVQLRCGRDSSFDISVTSEIMAIVCLVKSYEELEAGLSKILVGLSGTGKELYAKDFGAVEGMMRLLKHALRPNLVETTEGTPAIIHGGPFANIAHGCNSLIATETGLRLSDYVVTEAGFGADLGAEKFFNIKCRKSGLEADAVVLLISVRALKIHGGAPLETLDQEDLKALAKGLPNFDKHLHNCRTFSDNVIVCVNVFDTDSEQELSLLKEHYPDLVFADAYNKGSEGALDLAHKVVEMTQDHTVEQKLTYECADTYLEKILKVVTNIYGAEGIEMSDEVSRKIQSYKDQSLPICIAKTQYSFTDNPKVLGLPTGFKLTVSDVKMCSGAGFLIVYMGKVMTMPGLPKKPRGQS